MISLDCAKRMFEEMVNTKGGGYCVEQVSEIAFEDPIFVMIALDSEGNQIFPGEVFPSIRKKDGKFVDFSFPATG